MPHSREAGQCAAIFVFQLSLTFVMYTCVCTLRVRLRVCDIVFMTSHRGSVMAGVGIFFQQESDCNVYIKTIVSGVKSPHPFVAFRCLIIFVAFRCWTTASQAHLPKTVQTQGPSPVLGSCDSSNTVP